MYQLLQKAESCHCLRDKRGQYEFGKALEQFSYPFNLIGGYYQAFYLGKIGQTQTAYENLERARQELKGIYSDKAALSLSTVKEMNRDFDASMKMRLALTKSEYLPIAVESTIGIAALLSSQGEHDKALEHLERVLPLLPKLGNMPLPFDVYNSYATELAEVGKIELASEVIRPVILSPYTPYYSNWPETAREIQEKSTRKSMVTFNRSNVIYFPVREAEEPEEVEEIETEAEEPQFPYEHYITEKLDIRDKIENWMITSVEPDDLGALLIAVAETKDDIERSMILEEAIDSTFNQTPERREAKWRWRDDILAKMKDES